MGLLWCSSHRRGARARAARWLGLQIVTASRIAVLFGESIDSARLVGMGIPSRVRLPLPRNPGSHWVKVERAQGGCSISRRPYQRPFTHAQYRVISARVAPLPNGCPDCAVARAWPQEDLRTFTLAVVPMRNGCAGSGSSTLMRTGTRCVTFTQLPVAFCGGRSENAVPLPPERLTTVPWKGGSG